MDFFKHLRVFGKHKSLNIYQWSPAAATWLQVQIKDLSLQENPYKQLLSCAHHFFFAFALSFCASVHLSLSHSPRPALCLCHAVTLCVCRLSLSPVQSSG